MQETLTVPDALTASWEKHLQLIAELFNVHAALVMRLDMEHIEVFVSSGGSTNPYQIGESGDPDSTVNGY